MQERQDARAEGPELPLLNCILEAWERSSRARLVPVLEAGLDQRDLELRTNALENILEGCCVACARLEQPFELVCCRQQDGGDFALPAWGGDGAYQHKFATACCVCAALSLALARCSH